MLLLTLVGLLIAPAQAQSPLPRDSAVHQAPSIPSTPPTSEELLRAALETTKSFQQDILATVYWSLGTVAAMGLLLVGFSWFTNYKVYERDKAVLTQELRDFLTMSLAKAEESLRDSVPKALSTEHNRRFDDLEAKVTSVLSQVAALRSSSESVARRVEFVRLAEEAHYWELRKVPGNEIDRYRDMLGIAASAKRTNDIGECLSNIERLLDGGTPIFWSFVPGFLAVLDTLGPDFHVQVTRIRDRLKTAPQS